PHRDLRELTRYRTPLVQERAREVKRLQKGLEGAPIQLATVATDVRGKSGQAILRALVEGITASAALAQLAQLARGRRREQLPQLAQARRGQVGPHQRFLLAQQVAHLDFLEAAWDRVNAEIAERLHPFDVTVARVQGIAGVGPRIAHVLVAELGTD